MTKTIITTIGTSLITNYFDYQRSSGNTDNDFNDSYEKLKTISFYEPTMKVEHLQRHTKNINTKITDFYVNDENRKKILCAEINSIEAIRNELELDRKGTSIYLLCTDTSLSNICAKYIAKWLKDLGYDEKNILFEENNPKFVIPKLNVNDKISFNDGFHNLINVLDEITKDQNYLINITGGYKAVIPILTIFAQLKKLQIFYIYNEEKSESSPLLTLKSLPISFNWEVVQELLHFLDEKSLNALKSSPDSDDREAYKLVSNRLIEFSLINKDNALSAVGNLFKKISEKTMPDSKSTLGFLVEYKLLEYYLYSCPNRHSYNIERSIYLDDVLTKKRVGEIDFKFIDKSTNNYITSEVKSFAQVANYIPFHQASKDDGKSVKEKFYTQLEFVRDNWSEAPSKVKYVVYQLLIGYNNKKTRQKLNENLKELEKIVNQVFKNKNPIPKFEVDIINIKINQRDNSYAQFMEGKLNESAITFNYNFKS